MITERKDEAGGMDPRDDKALWNLLGRQKPPVEASPYFARRVLREIALDEEGRGSWFLRVRRFCLPTPRHMAVWSGAFALGLLCLSVMLVIPTGHPPVARSLVAPVYAVESSASVSVAPSVAPEADPPATVAPVQDAELIADLDDLLSREESRLWTEDDTARF